MKQLIITALNKNKAMKMAYKGITASLLGLLVMACAACGGGGGGGSSPSPQAQTAQASKPVLIDAEGDSTMFGYEAGIATEPTPNNAPAVLQGLMQGRFGNTVTVVDSGSNGATVDMSLKGYAAYTAPFQQRLAAIPAQIVLSNYGINDARLRTTAQYQDDLASWIGIVRAAGKTPVLEEPNPVCDPDYANLDAYVGIMRNVAQQQGVLLITQYDYIKSLPNWQGMLTDCKHPNDALYAVKAQREYSALAPLVSSLEAQ